MWRPATMVDHPDALAVYRAQASAYPSERGRRWLARYGRHLQAANPPVRCECGRTVSADMMVAVPPAFSDAFHGRLYVCDACLERGYMSARLSRASFLAAVGAPASVTDRVSGR
jgi:hypothetical protein